MMIRINISKESLHIFILALQESFIASVPYIIIASIAILIPQILSFFDIGSLSLISSLRDISKVINRFVPIVVSISIAYHFSLRYYTNQMNVMFLSLLSVVTIEYITTKNPLSYNLDFDIISIPIVATFLISGLSKYFNISFVGFNAYLYIYRVFKYIYTFIISYIIIIILYLILHWVYSIIHQSLTPVFSSISDGVMLYIRSILSQLFWFVGIHGPHMVSSILDTSFLRHDIFIGLSYQKFYQLFATFGGSGAGLAMLLALFLNKEDKQGVQIAKISLPFTIFNINGILIYGLPIVFNRYLLIPFLFIPLFNITVAYIFLHIYNIVFLPVQFAWTTPIFINGWILSNGDIGIVLFQLFLLILNTAMYLPFIKKYSKTNKKSYYINELEKKLDITTSIQAREGLPVLKTQKDILDSSHKVSNVINLINKNSLIVHYQPKVDIDEHECIHYESLLRLKKSDGSLVGPYFLEDLENAGLAPVIDIWVCKEVKKDLLKWRKQEFEPFVSINLHPHTLADSKAIKQIMDELKGENIEFEILEKSLLDECTKDTIQVLKEHGFAIAIDDFGVGYSSFELITKFDIDTIKMDKSIIDLLSQPKGYAICKHIVSLCDDIDCKCIAEGVETKEQLDKLYKMGTKYVQGFYFSKALPPDKMLDYSDECEENFSDKE